MLLAAFQKGKSDNACKDCGVESILQNILEKNTYTGQLSLCMHIFAYFAILLWHLVIGLPDNACLVLLNDCTYVHTVQMLFFLLHFNCSAFLTSATLFSFLKFCQC